MAYEKDMVKVNGGELKSLKERYGDLENIKEGFIGKGQNGKFDIYKDKTDGSIYVALKSNKEETQYYICNTRSF